MLDAQDATILQTLYTDGRASIASLSRQVGLSAPSTSERLKRLEEAGVVEGYTIRINLDRLGLPVAAWLRVRPIPGALGKVAALLADIPEIVECDRITGEDCFVAKAHVKSMADLEALIDKIIPYATTNTSIIQSSPVAPRLPPV